MKQFLFDNKQKLEIEETVATSSSSTLLIPEIYLAELNQKILEYGSLSEYLTYLLKEYDLFLRTGIMPKSTDLKTVYQLKDQNLKRKDFRPAQKDWLLLKLYRVGMNYSISYLFVFLLRLDLINLALVVRSALNFVGAPFPAPIFQYGGLSSNTKIPKYFRIYQHY